jgi:tetratricopeptide (TPR) repeat protein
MARRKDRKQPGGKAARTPVDTPRWPLFAAMAALFVAVWLAYAPALDNDFVSWDDPDYVTERPEVLDPTPEHRAKLWRMPVSLNYHPLTMMTLAWNAQDAPRDRRTGTLSARPFITTNVFLHAVNTMLVLLLVHALTRGRSWPSLLAGVVFGLHPMHVESVAWVSERKDVLYVLFFLAGLLTHLRWLRSGRWSWYAATLLLFVAACLSKAMAVVFPVALLLVDLHERRPLRSVGMWTEKLPHFALAIYFGLMAMDIQRGGDMNGALVVDRALGSTGAVSAALPYTAWDQFRFGAFGFTHYLLRFLLPGGHSTFHPYPDPANAGLLFLAGPLVMLATAGVALWSLRKGRTVLFGLGFFTVGVALVLQFIPVGRAVMAERYTYLPYVGLGYLLALGVERLLADKAWGAKAWAGLTLAVALVLIPLTRTQADVWQDTRSLFAQVIARYPTTADPYSIVGSWYGKRSVRERRPELLDSAGAWLRAGVLAGAHSGPLFEAYGSYHGSQGRTDSALYWFGRAIDEGPVTGQLLHNRAQGRAANDLQGALQDLDRAIAMGHPQVGDSYVLRARLHAQQGRYAEAVSDVDTALARFGKRRGDTLALRAICKFNLGDRAGAAADAREALTLDPGLVQARQVLQATGG